MSIKLKSANQGFTLVELLIVIVVIAILAAITIVAYGNVTAKAKDAGYQSDAASVVSLIESYNADTGAYPTASNVTSGALTWSSGTLTAKQPSSIKINPYSSGTTAFSAAPSGTIQTTTCGTAGTWKMCDDGSGTKYYSVWFCTGGADVYYVSTAGGTTGQVAKAGSGC